MTEALRACPFEHTGAELVCTGDGIQSWMACRICGALGPVAHTEAQARAAWNRRAPVAQPAITRTDDTLSGAWRIAGTRISTRTIYDARRGGWDAKRILAEWHGITAEDVRLAVEFEALRTIGAALRRRALPTREEVAAELHSWLFADRDEPANSEWEKLSESRQWAFLGAADAILDLFRRKGVG